MQLDDSELLGNAFFHVVHVTDDTDHSVFTDLFQNSDGLSQGLLIQLAKPFVDEESFNNSTLASILHHLWEG